ncbi:hypothetical protein ASPZODRAFT_152146 [Penicilliopsis zonata CBS 506.65]|uniref:Zn(2)-C6 fungal-type domain-containing protein n=1 Tax=Penicilliopsis zonata CBS 506.65 TaxID=1073090 RepID=A0A1L9SHV7_9EURO|nr:hypothetical protein ASPZODRAFT_152146 [Penicilliopsis zonata CBS 506.65]OJJ46711.1 hypothetical protein ASPZODRAFT_152146 [Penicilliopsis zonata CBS 506.65]
MWHGNNHPPGSQHPAQPISVSPYPLHNHSSTLPPAPDQKKHKRTRSGCFTCRSRRIKCDEARPVCERCRKGNRDCVYPVPTSKSSTSKTRNKSPESKPASQGSASPGDTAGGGLETIVDEDAAGSSPSTPATAAPITTQSQISHSLDTGSHTQQAANLPSPTDFSTTHLKPLHSLGDGDAGGGGPSQSGTPPPPGDEQFYLDFHQRVLTHHHYFLRQSGSHFMRHTIIEHALQYEPLLYAVVAFSAYHHSLRIPGGTLHPFLKYYNLALQLLRRSLGAGEEHTKATLITVLVLTTIEEYVGDWVNLIDHHQAAHALMNELLSPESIKTNDLDRHIFIWYARFDVVAGILAGAETVLGWEWYMAIEQGDAEQAALYPHDIGKQLALCNSLNRRFGLELASLYARLSSGVISLEDFAIENAQLQQILDREKSILQQYEASEHAITDFPHSLPLNPDDIVNPYVPRGLYKGPLWEANYIWVDMLATTLMFRYQSIQALGTTTESPEELQALALEQCRFIESIERWPDKEEGSIIAFRNSLGILSIFLPRDSRHIMWSRRKFAQLESNGYITAQKYRTVLATVWDVPDLPHWWLPNDEAYPPLIREIRTMTHERASIPRDHFREDVRDMKMLFWKINLGESPDGSSPNSTE